MSSLIKSPIIWVGAALFTAGFFMWRSAKGGDGSKGETTEPPKNVFDPSYSPTQADCDWAYSHLPHEVQSQYEYALDQLNKTGFATALEAMAKAADADTTMLDPKVRKVFAACVRKAIKLSKSGGPAASSLDDDGSTGPSVGPTAYADGLGDSASPPITYAGAPDASTTLGQIHTLLKPHLNEIDVLKPVVNDSLGSSLDWPAIKALPNSPLKTDTLNAVSGVNYAAMFSEDLNDCLNNGGRCESWLIRNAILRLQAQASDLGYGSGALVQAAILELDRAAAMLEADGL